MRCRHTPDLALHIEDLTVAYNDKPVLWDIDIDVPPGVLAAIIGPNGAGKSTRQQSLLGDPIAHAALPGVCLGFLLSGSREPLPIFVGALLSRALAAAFTLLLTNRSRLKTDAALGASLSLVFAVGLVLLTFIQRRAGSGQAGL